MQYYYHVCCRRNIRNVKTAITASRVFPNHSHLRARVDRVILLRPMQPGLSDAQTAKTCLPKFFSFPLKITRLRARRHGLKCHSSLGDGLAYVLLTCFFPFTTSIRLPKISTDIILQSVNQIKTEFADLNE